jgi:hypothetical protein
MQLGEQLDGVVLAITEFAPIGGTEKLVVLTSVAQYYYDVANDTFVDVSLEDTSSYAITAVNTSTPSFSCTAAVLQFPTGSKFVVTGSTGNDGTYTVANAAGSPTVVITVEESIPDDTVDGNIRATTRWAVTVADDVNDHFTVAEDVSAIFSAGDKFWVRESAGGVHDGTWEIQSVSGSGPTELYVTGDITSSTATGNVTRRDELTYAEGMLINYAPVTDINGRRLLMTNGVDNPLQWTGDTSDPDHFMRWVPYFENFVTCETLWVFKEHLFLGNVETAASEPQLVAWSDAGDFENFIDGTAGAQLLYELPTGIQGMKTLGDRLIVYSQDAIASGIYVGLPAVFAFETIIPEGTRLTSPKSVVSINVGHVYASEENFYLFDGSRGLRTLSDIIRSDYKTVKDHDTLYKTAAINDYSKKTIYVAFPDSDTGAIVYTMEYDAFNLAQRAWSKIKYADAPRAFGFFTNVIDYTWADTAQETALAGSMTPPQSYLYWQDEVGFWHNEGEQGNFPVRVFGDASGYVYLDSESVLSDNGSTQDGHYETMDFTVPQEFLSALGRWGEIEFEARGDSVDVYTSAERGGTNLLVESVTLSAPIKTYRLPIDITSRTLRIRFEFTGDFLLRWVRAWVKPAATR